MGATVYEAQNLSVINAMILKNILGPIILTKFLTRFQLKR